MLAFITSIRHPLNSSHYPTIERLLERTLGSICAQTHRDFKVVVVCHRVPDIAYDPAHVDFVLVDYAPPSQVAGPQTGIQAVRLDKGSKLLAGMLVARRYQPSHVMFFDADDLLSRRIAEHVAKHPDANGWYMAKGYTWTEGGAMLRLRSNFHQLCGTSHVLRTDVFDLGEEAIDIQDQATLLKRSGRPQVSASTRTRTPLAQEKRSMQRAVVVRRS